MNGRGKGRGRTLITGASRGIGMELARVFARRGHDLVLTARSGEELGRLARELERDHGVAVHTVPADLGAPGTPERLHGDLATAGLDVDVLVNNAGFGSRGPFHESDPDEQLGMLRVNVEALTHLTRLLLPPMLARGGGRVLQVASTASFQPGPLMAVYYASKAYVLHLSEALDEEVRSGGVTVTTLCPGPVPTGFQERAGTTETGLMKGLLPRTDAVAVAEAGYRGMMRGRRIVVPGLVNRTGALAVRFLPRRLVTKVARRLNQVA